MKNKFMEKTCQNMLSSLKIFKESLKISALADDGMISPDEERFMKQMNAITDAYKEAIECCMNVYRSED